MKRARQRSFCFSRVILRSQQLCDQSLLTTASPEFQALAQSDGLPQLRRKPELVEGTRGKRNQLKSELRDFTGVVPHPCATHGKRPFLGFEFAA
jgi:predicted ATP-dependent endonuclease of OLD family